MAEPSTPGAEIDAILDLLPRPVMSWQRKVLHQVLACTTPDDLFCNQPPRDQYRMGLAYADLMEHFACEVIRKSRE